VLEFAVKSLAAAVKEAARRELTSIRPAVPFSMAKATAANGE
jgi:hypothetical protein